MMMTEILKTKGTWQDVINDCRSTVGKNPIDHDPSTEFKKKILIAEHSPIRDISIRWKWDNIPSWVATHWSRHKFEKFIKTQRSDRTGKDRSKLPQDTPVSLTGDANIQSLIDVWRKRLCYQASPETRKYAEDFKAELYTKEPEISRVLVPNCIYRAGCSEMKTCGLWKRISSEWTKEQICDIETRYNLYNELFYDKVYYGCEGSFK